MFLGGSKKGWQLLSMFDHVRRALACAKLLGGEDLSAGAATPL
jgi:hypothetical protein